LGFAPGLLPGFGLQRESLDFEPALALEAPLLLQLLVELQKQLALVLELEPQLVELLRKEQKRRLNPFGFEPALGLWLLQELRPLELMRLPGLEVRQLRLLVELQKQLELVLALELQLEELLRQG